MRTTSSALSSEALHTPVAVALRAVGVVDGVATSTRRPSHASESGTRCGCPSADDVAIHTLASRSTRRRASALRCDALRMSGTYCGPLATSERSTAPCDVQHETHQHSRVRPRSGEGTANYDASPRRRWGRSGAARQPVVGICPQRRRSRNVTGRRDVGRRWCRTIKSSTVPTALRMKAPRHLAAVSVSRPQLPNRSDPGRTAGRTRVRRPRPRRVGHPQLPAGGVPCSVKGLPFDVPRRSVRTGEAS
jgi:hypothetical protein